jgi:hypothetical protein
MFLSHACRLTAVPEYESYFDRPRSIAASLLVAAGGAGIIGSFLNWVIIEPPGIVPDNQASRLDPFTGIEAGDGWFTIAAGIVLLACALALFVTKRSSWAWLAFFTAIFMGAVSIGDYRDLDQLFYQEMERIGDPSPALGLTLVAAASFVGLIGAVTGIAATPRDPT